MGDLLGKPGAAGRGVSEASRGYHLVAVVCTLYDESVTGGHTLHTFLIGRIANNTALIVYKLHFTTKYMQEVLQEITRDAGVLVGDWISACQKLKPARSL